MTHKEEMEWLKEHDPITYSELNSDPCGSGEDDGWIGTIIFCLIFAALTFGF